jgi:hypothetical protein
MCSSLKICPTKLLEIYLLIRTRFQPDSNQTLSPTCPASPGDPSVILPTDPLPTTSISYSTPLATIVYSVVSSRLVPGTAVTEFEPCIAVVEPNPMTPLFTKFDAVSPINAVEATPGGTVVEPSGSGWEIEYPCPVS